MMETPPCSKCGGKTYYPLGDYVYGLTCYSCGHEEESNIIWMANSPRPITGYVTCPKCGHQFNQDKGAICG